MKSFPLFILISFSTIFFQSLTPLINCEDIPVFYTVDKNVILPSIVSLTSLCETAKDTTKYLITLMPFGSFTEDDKSKLLAINTQYPNKCSLKLVAQEDFFKLYPIKYDDINKIDQGTEKISSYAVLAASQLIPSVYETMIYLDGGDTMILEDLSVMFGFDIGDYYYLGHDDYFENQQFAQFINQTDSYINSQVLVMNLRKLREDNIWEKYKLFIEENNKDKLNVPAQIILNHFCQSNVGFLPSRYGMFSKVSSIDKVGDSYSKKKYCLSIRDCMEAFANPAIVNFAGKQKPYHGGDTVHYSHYWWFYARKTLVFNEMVELYARSSFTKKPPNKRRAQAKNQRKK